jgi:pilus assembly protein FimV
MASVNKSKLVQSAQKHLGKGNLDKALKEYQKILEADPQDMNVRLKVGELRERQGDRKEAIKEYQRVGSTFTSKGFYSKAVAVLKRISAIDPESLEVHIDLADLNQKLGLLSEVVHHYQLAADIYDRQGEKRKAIDILKKVAEVGPPNFERKLKVAELYYKEGFPEAGYEQFIEATSELPTDSSELVEMVDRMCKACPADPLMKRRLAEVQLARGNLKSAKQALEEALAIDREATTLELLGEVESQSDAPERAKALFEEAVGLYEQEDNDAKTRELSERLRELSTVILEETPEGPVVEKGSAGSGVEARSAEAESPAPGDDSTTPEAETPAPSSAPDPFMEDKHLESALSEAEVYLKYRKPEGAIEILEDLAERYPHRHEPALRLREILDGAEDWEGVAAQCRRLAAIAEGRGQAELAARYQAESEEALGRLSPSPEEGKEEAPVSPTPGDEEPSPEETPKPIPETSMPPRGFEPDVVIDPTTPPMEAEPEVVIVEETPPSPSEAVSAPVMEAGPASVKNVPSAPAQAVVEEDLLIRPDAFEEEAVPREPPAPEAASGRDSGNWGDLEFVVDAPGVGSAGPSESAPVRPAEESVAGKHAEQEPAPREDPEPEAGSRAAEAPEETGTAPLPVPDLEEAEFYASQGMIEEALGIYRHAVEVFPGDASVQSRYETLLAKHRRSSPEPEAPSAAPGHRDGTSARAAEAAAEAAALAGAEVESPGEEADAVAVLEEPAEEAVWEWGVEGGPLEVSIARDAASEPEPAFPAPGAAEEILGPVPGNGEAAAPPPVAPVVPGPLEEGFDLRAALERDQEVGGGAGTVSEATRELSNLVSELQLQEEEDASSAVDGQTHYDLGIAYKEMGLLEDAVRELRLAARDPARQIDCFTVLGICYREQGRPDEAVRMIEGFLAEEGAAGEKAPGIVYEMAAAQEEAGKASEALKWFERVSEIDPEFRDVRERLSSLRRSQGSDDGSDSPGSAPRSGERKKAKKKKKISFL